MTSKAFILGRRDGPASKGTSHASLVGESEPRTQVKVEGKNLLHKVVL